MKLDCTIERANIALNGDVVVEFATSPRNRGMVEEFIAKYKTCEKQPILSLEVKKKSERRSKSANAYFYVLQSELARVLGTANDELHRELVFRYADCQPILMAENVDPTAIIPYCKKHKEVILNGKKGVYWLCFTRSSEMNTKQFSKLLDGLISECKEVGIETMTADELARFEDYGDEKD